MKRAGRRRLRDRAGFDWIFFSFSFFIFLERVWFVVRMGGLLGSSRMGSSDGFAGGSALTDVDKAAGLLGAGGLELLLVITDGGLDGILGKHRAVQLDWRQAQLLGYLRVPDGSRLLQAHSLHSLRHVRRAGNGRTTAKSLELDIRDDALVVDPDLELHDVTAGGSADQAGADVHVSLGERAYVSWVFVVVNHLLVVRTCLLCADASGSDGGALGETRERGTEGRAREQLEGHVVLVEDIVGGQWRSRVCFSAAAFR